jgi:SNW domain-containing protein 1
VRCTSNVIVVAIQLTLQSINSCHVILQKSRYTEGAKQRVIRMVEAQVDPMEPPKHLIKKVPRGPGSPPVPILHSPPRKLTVEDKQAWKVPPCISNWKNARGYTIPLDKRLAADGRGLQEVTINNKFATLSESLYVAERKASEDLRIRNQIRKKMAMREKEDRERDLRDMASKARMDRAGVAGEDEDEEDFGVSEFDEQKANSNSSKPGGHNNREREEIDEPPRRSSGSNQYDDRNRDDDRRRDDNRGGDRDRDRDGSHSNYSNNRDSNSKSAHDDRRENYGRDDRDRDEDEDERPPQGETSDERVARQQRERLRQDRRKEREREIRLENMKVTLLYKISLQSLLQSDSLILYTGQHEEE